MTNDELKRLFPRASQSFIQRNAARLRANNPEPTQGNALVGVVPGKEKSGTRTPICTEPSSRLRIRFTIYAVRPADWDAWHVKELQDLLIKSGILSGDEWYSLEGQVCSEKVYSKEEERTEIEIMSQGDLP